MSNSSNSFEPEITAFYCIYCGYMAADTAGALSLQYPANVKFIRMPCTGKTDIRYLLEAFEQGADGVYVVACPIGNCHHVRGNERGLARPPTRQKNPRRYWYRRRPVRHVLYVRQPGEYLCPGGYNHDRADPAVRIPTPSSWLSWPPNSQLVPMMLRTNLIFGGANNRRNGLRNFCYTTDRLS